MKDDSYTWSDHENGKKNYYDLEMIFIFYAFFLSFSSLPFFGWFKRLWLSSCGYLWLMSTLKNDSRLFFKNRVHNRHFYDSIKIFLYFFCHVPFFIAFYDCRKVWRETGNMFILSRWRYLVEPTVAESSTAWEQIYQLLKCLFSCGWTCDNISPNLAKKNHPFYCGET